MTAASLMTQRNCLFKIAIMFSNHRLKQVLTGIFGLDGNVPLNRVRFYGLES